MATIDTGFKVGDWCIPESFNLWAKTKEPCQVIEEDGRYVMTIRLHDGSTDIVHPYRWKHVEVGAGETATEGHNAGVSGAAHKD